MSLTLLQWVTYRSNDDWKTASLPRLQDEIHILALRQSIRLQLTKTNKFRDLFLSGFKSHLKGLKPYFLSTTKGSYMWTQFAAKLYFTWEICVFVFFWVFLTGLKWLGLSGKRWCHILLSTNQDLAVMTVVGLFACVKKLSIKSDQPQTPTLFWWSRLANFMSVKPLSWAFILYYILL